MTENVLLKLDEVERTDDILVHRKSLIIESNKLLDQLENIACENMSDVDCENLDIVNSNTSESKLRNVIPNFKSTYIWPWNLKPFGKKLKIYFFSS